MGAPGHRRATGALLAASFFLLAAAAWSDTAAAPRQALTADADPGEWSRPDQTLHRFSSGLTNEGGRFAGEQDVVKEVEFAQTNIEESVGPLEQAVVVLAGGGFGVVWEEGHYWEGDVRMQWLDREARPLFAAGGQLIAGTPAAEYDPVIVAHPSAGAYVAFQLGIDSQHNDIVVQYFDVNGEPQWPGDGVLAAIRPPNADLRSPHLVANPASGVFVCFEFTEGSTCDIRCQHIDSTGKRRWSDSGASVGNGGDQELRVRPKGLSDGAGGLMLFWRNQRDRWQEPGEGRAGDLPMLMEGQRFSRDGQKLWGAVPKVVRTTGLASDRWWGGSWPSFFQVVSDGNGGAVLAFDDWNGADLALGVMDVMAQRVSGAGDLLWGVGTVVTGADGLQKHEQTIGAGDGGAFVAVWEDVGPGHDQLDQLRLFRLGPDGSHAWPSAGLLLSTAAYGVVGSFDGGILRLAWNHGYASPSDEADVRFVTYSPEGQVTGSTWLTRANGPQVLRGLARSPESGGTLGVWDDRRKGTFSDQDVMGAFLAPSDLIFMDGFEEFTPARRADRSAPPSPPLDDALQTPSNLSPRLQIHPIFVGVLGYDSDETQVASGLPWVTTRCSSATKEPHWRHTRCTSF